MQLIKPLNVYEIFFFSVCLFIISTAHCQSTLKIQPGGQKLKDFYLSLNVENLWLPQHHVNWETGEPDEPEAEHGNKTHCSAFIASACKRLNIYILRPPQHEQILLANAQFVWLNNGSGDKSGWTKLDDNADIYNKAQQLANQGKVVVAIYKNTDSSKPGHAALVMPANRSATQLAAEGPQLIMAGTHNYNYIALKKGFRNHITAWPSPEIAFFVHDVML